MNVILTAVYVKNNEQDLIKPYKRYIKLDVDRQGNKFFLCCVKSISKYSFFFKKDVCVSIDYIYDAEKYYDFFSENQNENIGYLDIVYNHTSVFFPIYSPPRIEVDINTGWVLIYSVSSELYNNYNFIRRISLFDEKLNFIRYFSVPKNLIFNVDDFDWYWGESFENKKIFQNEPLDCIRDIYFDEKIKKMIISFYLPYYRVAEYEYDVVLNKIGIPVNIYSYER